MTAILYSNFNSPPHPHSLIMLCRKTGNHFEVTWTRNKSMILVSLTRLLPKESVSIVLTSDNFPQFSRALKNNGFWSRSGYYNVNVSKMISQMGNTEFTYGEEWGIDHCVVILVDGRIPDPELMDLVLFNQKNFALAPFLVLYLTVLYDAFKIFSLVMALGTFFSHLSNFSLLPLGMKADLLLVGGFSLFHFFSYLMDIFKRLAANKIYRKNSCG